MLHVDLHRLADTLKSEDRPTVDVDGQVISCVVAFQTAQSQTTLFLLAPDQHIPAHTHNSIDDIFFGLEGTGRIRTWDAAGQSQDWDVKPGTMVVVPPETPHEVFCAGAEFCYLLLQTPKDRYDNIPYLPQIEVGVEC